MNIPLGHKHNISASILIEKSRFQSILKFSTPLIIGMIGFSLVGLIDTAMVGRLGDVALASVGVGNMLFFLLLSFSMGLGTSVHTLTARRVGEGKIHLAGYDLNMGILIGVVMGLALMILGYLLFPLFVSLVNQDSKVVEQAVAYLMARLPQILFMCMAASFRSYWSSTNMPQLVMLDMMIVVWGNAIFNYLFIFGNFGFPRLEIVGAGFSSALASLCSLLVYFVLGLKHAKKNGFLKGLPDRKRTQTLISLSIPVSISRFLELLSVIAMFFIVGLIGTKELAAYTVINSFIFTVVLITAGMGVTAITFVGQALGRKEVEDAKKWGWEIARIGFGVMLVIGLLVILFPQTILSIFIVDESTITIATIPMQLSGSYVCLLGFSTIISSGLIGAGATKTALVLTLAIQWCLAIPLQWLLSIYLGYGLIGIPLSFIITHIFGALIISFIWHRERWALIKI